MSRIRYCRRCGKALAQSSHFCDNCGEPVEQMLQDMRAPNVPRGSGGDHGAVPQRRNAGSQMNTPPTRQRRSVQQSDQSERSWQQPWKEPPEEDDDDGFTPIQYVLIGLMVLLLIVLIAFCAFWIFGKKSDSEQSGALTAGMASEQQMEQDQKHDVIEILDNGQSTSAVQTEKQTQKQSEKQTEKQTQKQTERQTEKQTASAPQIVTPSETQKQSEKQTEAQTELIQIIEIQQSPNQQIEVQGTLPSVSSGGNGYLAQSSQRVLTDADVSGMTYNEMQMAINEIYARHGRIFASTEIQSYFESQSWYHGTTDAEHFSDSVFSSTEAQNIQFLLKKMGVE